MHAQIVCAQEISGGGARKGGESALHKEEGGCPAHNGSLSCHARTHQTAPSPDLRTPRVPQLRAQPWYSTGSAPNPRRGTEGSTPSQLKNWNARLPNALKAELQCPGGRHQCMRLLV